MSIIQLPPSTTYLTGLLIADQNDDGTTPQGTIVEIAPGIFTPASAALEIQSTNGALILPRMTTTQRNNMGGDYVPGFVPGMLLYNTSVNKVQALEDTTWVDLSGGGGGGAPTTATYLTVNDETAALPNSYRTILSNNGTKLGDLALSSITSGADNTAIGFHSLKNTTIGYANVGVGAGTLENNVEGYANMAIGYGALNNTNGIAAMSEGVGNVAVGIVALASNTTGSGNMAFGAAALGNATTASGNIAIGAQAAGSTTVGSSITAIGTQALFANVTGGSHVAIGTLALHDTTGNDCLAIGVSAGSTNIGGSGHTIIGNSSGTSNFTTANDCTFIGRAINPTVDGLTNAGAIGAGATISVSNAINLGNACKIGVNKPSPDYPLHIAEISNVSAFALDTTTNVPATPASGMVIYSQGTSLYSKDTAGTVTDLTAGGGGGVSLSAVTTVPGKGVVLTPDPITGTGTVGLVTSIQDNVSGFSAGNSALISTGPTNKSIAIGISVMNGTFFGTGNNLGVGNNIMTGLLSGHDNVCFGIDSMTSADDALHCTAIGISVLKNNLSGTSCVGVGEEALRYVVSNNNTAVGVSAGRGNDGVTSYPNINNGTFLGYGADVVANTLTNCMALGSGATIAISNAANIGNACNVGINNPSPLYPVHIAEVSNVSALALNATTNVPADPASGMVIYSQGTSLYAKDSAGTVTDLTAGGGGGVSLSAVTTVPGKGVVLTPDPITGTGTIGLTTSIQDDADGISFGNSAQIPTGTTNDNLAIGNTIMNNTFTGTGRNLAIGKNIMPAITSGASNNVCYGTDILVTGDSISDCVAIGIATLKNNNFPGNSNVGVGNSALEYVERGSNTAIGHQAGRCFDGLTSFPLTTNGTFVGAAADVTADGFTNCMALGAGTTISRSNGANIGNNAYVGINNPNPKYALHISNVVNVAALTLDASTNTPSDPDTGGAIYSKDDVLYFKNRFGTIFNLIARKGQDTLNGTTGVTISEASVSSTSKILVSSSSGAGSPTLANVGSLVVGDIVDGVSFTVYSTNASDTNTVNWAVFN